jgi:hypothetical protein
MADVGQKVTIVIEKDGQRTTAESDIARKIVVIINTQFTNAPNTTQIASGAGGTNSAIESSNTKQQHAIGGGKKARASNKGIKAKQREVP